MFPELTIALAEIYIGYIQNFPHLRNFQSAFRLKDGTFKSSCTALGGTVGTGNIAGVALAINYGGAGAVFWMWVSAIIGMGAKYCEIYFAGKFHGTPMDYIERGLPKKFKLMAIIFSFFAILSSLGTGNMVQVKTACDSVGGGVKTGIIIGGIMGILALLWLSADVDKVSSVVVPVMAGAYVIIAVIVILKNLPNLPSSIYRIFSEAMSYKGIISGAAIKWGFRRGLLSNEAGMGTAAIAHRGSGEKPETEALSGVFEVTWDTLIICTLTALMLLCSESDNVSDAISTVLGNNIGSAFIAGISCLFAISSLAAWESYGDVCTRYLFGKSMVKWYRVIFLTLASLGSILPMKTIISISDTLNMLMLVTNITALVLLVRK
jgi:AGCS family alanine or glycine:cation symporter